jgi:predicted amidohydrolase
VIPVGQLRKPVELPSRGPCQTFLCQDKKRQLGTLKPGVDADIAIVERREGNFIFGDSDHKGRLGRQMLVTTYRCGTGECQ